MNITPYNDSINIDQIYTQNKGWRSVGLSIIKKTAIPSKDSIIKKSIEEKEEDDANNKNNFNTIRESSGMACFRFESVGKEKKFQILLVKKRYTYNFVAFVFGQYTKKDEKRLKSLFSGMTLQEKLDILSLNFEILWYKIWLELPNIHYNKKNESNKSSNSIVLSKNWEELYNKKASSCNIPYSITSVSKLELYMKKKNKFETCFVSDNGERLRNLIMNTKMKELVWEIPKGRINKNEESLDCAIREFKEETNIDIDSYSIIFNIRPIIETYVSSNVKYIHTYHMAFSPEKIEPIISFKYDNQISEIEQIRWVNIDEIKFIDQGGRLLRIVESIYTAWKAKYKHIK
jgi:8-oxo-dGTP pyrophosphatase MutT (NUDIX family)